MKIKVMLAMIALTGGIALASTLSSGQIAEPKLDVWNFYFQDEDSHTVVQYNCQMRRVGELADLENDEIVLCQWQARWLGSTDNMQGVATSNEEMDWVIEQAIAIGNNIKSPGENSVKLR